MTSRALACIAAVAREVAGVGDPVEVAGVEGDEPAGGVEHVDGAPLLRVGVADRGGEHGGHARRRRPARAAGRRATRRPGGALRAAVADDLDGEPRRAGSSARQAASRSRARSRAPGQHRPADVGVGAEQHDEPARGVAAPGSRRVPHAARGDRRRS